MVMTRPGLIAIVLLMATVTSTATSAASASAGESVGMDGHRSAIPVCGTVGGTLGGSAPLPVPAAEAVSGQSTWARVLVQGSVVSGSDNRGLLQSFTHDSSGWRQVGSVPVAQGPFAVDPEGSSYSVQDYYTLIKRSGDGTEVYRVRLPAPGEMLVGVPASSGLPWRLVVRMRDRTQFVDAATGSLDGPASVLGETYSGDGVEGIVSSDAMGLHLYDSSLREVRRIGSSAGANDFMPDGAALHFHVLTGALRLTDGRYLAADRGVGIWLLDPEGVVLGLAPVAASSGLGLALAGDRLVFIDGSGSAMRISSLPLDDVLALMHGAPPSSGPRLGFGAGVSTGVPGNFFASGLASGLKTAFEPSWRGVDGLSLRYTVRNAFQVAAQTPVPASTLKLPASTIDTPAALNVPAAAPGAYEADVHLLRDGVELSATCVHYTVGAPGMADLNALPGTADAGGPDGARGVALADAFGLGAHRLAMDWGKLLDKDGNTTFAYYDAQVKAAAAEAAKRGVKLSVQLGSGGPERAFVDNGTWGARVQEVVAHWAPYIDYWEAWNEPNITYGGDYTNNILKPFFQAVRAADPTAKVVGGTAVGIGYIPFWQALVNAGGLDFLDIAAIHPYPGHNRSFEEEGFLPKIEQTKAIFAKAGKPDLPVWITEFAFWSNGPANFFSQADKSVRAKIMAASLGITNWEYFLAQGTWGNNGVSFSAIEGQSGVKPAAIALMASRTELGGRTFAGWVDTGIPHVYAARYGPRLGSQPSDSDTVIATWSDDASLPAALSGPADTPVTLVDEYGSSHVVSLGAMATALTLTGSVQYLHQRAGMTLSLRAAEAWGANLALASNGSVATATTEHGLDGADKAIDGIGSSMGQGDFRSSSAWANYPNDPTPSLTVTFSASRTVDRVVMATGGLGSILSGVRDADLATLGPDGRWSTRATLRHAFALRTNTFTFPAVATTAIRLTVRAVNLGGYDGGAAPWFWPTDRASLNDNTAPWYGPTLVRELEAYAPGTLSATRAPQVVPARGRSAPTGSPAPGPGHKRKRGHHIWRGPATGA